MNQALLSIIILFVILAAVAAGIVGVSALIGRKKAPKERNIPYECGLDPSDKPRGLFSIKFFLIAALFLIFDVEVIFLIPWAVMFRSAMHGIQTTMLIAELIVFVLILALALVFAWARGALETSDS